MIALLSKLDSTVSIEAELNIEVNNFAFNLNVDKNSAMVLVDRWKDVLILAKYLGEDSKSFKHKFGALDTELKRLDITVFVRKRSIAVLGPKANPIYATLIKNLVPVLL